MCWTQHSAQEVQGRGEKSSGNKGDEKEEGAKVNGVVYRWKADHKDQTIAGWMETVQRNGWETWKGQVMDGKRRMRKKKTKPLPWKERSSEYWWKKGCVESDGDLRGKCRRRQERSSKLAGKADTKINQRILFFLTYRFKKKNAWQF